MIPPDARIVRAATRRLGTASQEVASQVIQLPDLPVGAAEGKLPDFFQWQASFGSFALTNTRYLTTAEAELRRNAEPVRALERRWRELQARHREGENTPELLADIEATRAKIDTDGLPIDKRWTSIAWEKSELRVNVQEHAVKTEAFVTTHGVKSTADLLTAEQAKLLGPESYITGMERLDDGLFMYTCENTGGARAVVFVDTTPGQPGGCAYIARVR